jgi:tRNA-specific 2-thiouridylase
MSMTAAHRHITVAVSGGIDSLMAALLLGEQGYSVSGVHFRTGYELRPEKLDRVLRVIEEEHGIPVQRVDVARDFAQQVVNDFALQYARGRTPNPCLVCNAAIKFGRVREMALQNGADGFATGHYARIVTTDAGHRRLLSGVDPAKDQSYFLSRLDQQQLAGTLFPLGHYTKNAVRRMAADRGLALPEMEDSQDICFIGKRSYTEFLQSEKNFSRRAGPIVDESGHRLGTHPGLHHFTIGQRRGINCPASRPYYVKEIDPSANRLVVAFEEGLYRSWMRVTAINWITKAPVIPLRLAVRLRYRHRPVGAMLESLSDSAATVRFDEPQRAITPGQGAVFYHGDRVLGGGWID